MKTEIYHLLLKVHWISVLAFLLLYTAKLILLLTHKIDVLNILNRKFKPYDMIISVIFLGTGIALLTSTGNTSHFLWIKLAMVGASIPIGIIGFKKQNKILATLCVLLIIFSYGMAEANKNNTKKQLQTVLQNTPEPKIQSSTQDTTQTEQYQKQFIEYGKQLYTAACVNCHGENGDLGKSGAKSLKTTQLTPMEKTVMIKKGKGIMPSYSSLSDTQIQAIVQYIETFKK